MPNVSDNPWIVHPENASCDDCSRVENVVNMYRGGDMDGSTRIFPTVVAHLSELMIEVVKEREERKKYFELFGWYPLRNEEDLAKVPRDELLIVLERNIDKDAAVYASDVLPSDNDEAEAVFLRTYKAYMRAPLCPYQAAELEPVDEAPAAH